MNKEWVDLYRSEIRAFAGEISAFEAGEISRKDYKGKSGGMGSYAQKTASAHMLRLRLSGGRLTRERLKFIADTVAKYQVGLLKLTTCEAIQLHNLKAEQVPEIMEAAIDVGIYTKGGGGDNPRNVMCSPLSGVQPGEAFDVMPWAQAAADYLLSICRDIHMPRKLKVAFCNGADDCVHAAFRDMGFTAQPDGTFSLRIAGGLGNNYRMGVLVDDAVPVADVLYCIRAMIETFCAHGNYENRAKARTRYMQETLGPDGLKAAYLEKFTEVKARGGLALSLEPALAGANDKCQKGVCREVAKAAGDSVDGAGTHTSEQAADGAKGSAFAGNPRVLAQKQSGLYAVAYHPIGGCLPAEKPAQLYALLADMPAEVECRVAPDGTLWTINLTEEGARRVLEATADGAQTAFEYSTSCIGATVCQQGLRDSQGMLHRLVDAVREAGIPDGALPRIHVSGCPSSCGAHQAAAIGLQGWSRPGADGKPAEAFKLFLDGGDAAGQEHFGTEAGAVYAAELPALFVELGRAVAASGQDWAEWSRTHAEERKAIIARYV